MLWAASASGDYPAYIGPGLLGAHPSGPRQCPAGGSWSPTATPRGCTPTRWEQLDGRVTIMPGEQSKTIAHAEIVWSELAAGVG